LHGLATNLVDGPRYMAILKDIERHFGKDFLTLNALLVLRFGKHGLAINLVDGPRSMAILKDIERHFGKDIIKLDAEVGTILKITIKYRKF
jgi:hypothetical protein